MSLATQVPAAGDTNKGGKAPAGMPVPFVRASHEHTEPAFDVTFTPGAASQASVPYEVPAYGFLRHILLYVVGTGGAIGGGALSADYPFNLFGNVTISDTNGYPMVSLDGYQLYMANVVGQYVWQSDPTTAPGYVGTINAVFKLRIPVEVTAWDGYGALPNLSASAAYKIRFTINPSTTLYSVAPGAIPAFQIRGYAECWSQPTALDLANNPQEQAPPGLGTTQAWTAFTEPIVLGANTPRLKRTGNLIRNIIVIARTAAGARSDTVLPDPLTLRWDNRDMLVTDPLALNRVKFYERTGISLPAGVMALDFTHEQDGKCGNENRHLWWATLNASRIELAGAAAAAGSWEVIVNDISTRTGR